MRAQEGVVSRSQLLAEGLADSDIARRLRRRELVRVGHGVYVDHTGPLSWKQRAWAALLDAAPAALADESALVQWKIREAAEGEAIHVAVPHARGKVTLAGAEVHRLRECAALVHPGRVPAVMRLEHAVLRVAAKRWRTARGEESVVALLTDACRTTYTNEARLGEALDLLPRLPGRAFLADVLRDLGQGTDSVLEHRYLKDVELAHGFPAAERQVAAAVGDRRIYRDVLYRDGLATPVCVELDGRLGHTTSEDRWRDLERDLSASRDGLVTVRLSWGQVLDPCRTATALASLLSSCGWVGRSSQCPSCSAPGTG